MAVKKRGLGRGLDALLGQSSSAGQGSENQEQLLKELPVDLIQRGKYQPRRDMDPQALEELANSIRVQGVMQPIVVRPIAEGRYEIIAGERRWRATQQAGLDSIPAVIRDVPDEAAIAMALIENIQREDLNPIEEAIALQRLQLEFELTQQQVADAVGKSRVSITNLLRLMALPDDVKLLLERGDLEMGHARALLGLPSEDQTAAARQVVAKGLTVRQTEALVRQWLNPRREAGDTRANPDIERLQQDLAERIGAEVKIQHGAKGKGKLVISYSSLDELDGVLMHIK
ncbi:MAG: ParB/RepB/Spo0J family partition protein [Pseudomonas sp.]|nr:ParB/RepB/Spo0J family partition protein [Pseudomonas sp.]MBQ0776991.1 ParB/RepB/Spo0J family partition protein [Pseudomonas sp.]|tara:strand:- start:20 stop:880 length:861 start_codon:yes stop_codon:yes gene_type:complete